jgi:hypothetical protein
MCEQFLFKYFCIDTLVMDKTWVYVVCRCVLLKYAPVAVLAANQLPDPEHSQLRQQQVHDMHSLFEYN